MGRLSQNLWAQVSQDLAQQAVTPFCRHPHWRRIASRETQGPILGTGVYAFLVRRQRRLGDGERGR